MEIFEDRLRESLHNGETAVYFKNGKFWRILQLCQFVSLTQLQTFSSKHTPKYHIFYPVAFQSSVFTFFAPFVA